MTSQHEKKTTTNDEVTSPPRRSSSDDLVEAQDRRAGRLVADCTAFESTIRRGSKVVPAVYLYALETPDPVLDAGLVRLLQEGKVPRQLIGTVSGQSSIRAHIAKLRSVPGYREAVVVIRPWKSDEDRVGGTFKWQQPLVLEEADGPVALLADAPVVDWRSSYQSEYSCYLHPSSRFGRYSFATTSSPDLYLSPSVHAPFSRLDKSVALLSTLLVCTAFSFFSFFIIDCLDSLLSHLSLPASVPVVIFGIPTSRALAWLAKALSVVFAAVIVFPHSLLIAKQAVKQDCRLHRHRTGASFMTEDAFRGPPTVPFEKSPVGKSSGGGGKEEGVGNREHPS